MKTIGFVGLGSMGFPMATNLLRAGTHLTIWNRTMSKAHALAREGAEVAVSVEELFHKCDVIIIMLAHAEAIDQTLGRGTEKFSKMISGKILINMGTNSPTYSRELEKDVKASGGRYVEAPVSGSRKPAEAGELICMMAGDTKEVEDILKPMCKSFINCGSVPSALIMKLAVNIFLINSVTGLAESLSFAREHKIDLEKFVSILNSSQMASDISRLKCAKFLATDYTKQAAISDVLQNARLIEDAARESELNIPLLTESLRLYQKAEMQGQGQEDMISVVEVFKSSSPSVELSSFIKNWLKAWTGNRPEELFSYYSPNSFYRDPYYPQGLRGEEFRSYLQKLLQKNPNWKWEPTEIFPTSTGATLKWKATIPTEVEIKTVEGLDLIEIEGDKIVRNEVYFDLSLLK